jgi:hypothetical protein
MGDPIIVWNPRIGASGDDRFNIPGATKINGDLDEDGEPCLRRNYAEGAVPFSSFSPSLPEVEAGSDISQLCALYFHKRHLVHARTGILNPLIGFGVSSAIDFNEVAAAVQQLAYYEGFEHDLIQAEEDELARGDLFARLRKQCGLFGTSRLWNGLPVTQNQAFMGHATAVYGPFLIPVFSVPRLDQVTNIGGVTVSSRKRASCALPLYPWMLNWQNFNVRVVVSNLFNCTGELWLSSTPRNLFFATWDFLVGTWNSDGTHTFNLNDYAAILRNTANNHNTFHLCTTEERELPFNDPVNVGNYAARLEFLQDFGD